MVLYFSGTGNSQYAAQRISETLGDQLLSINDRIKAGNTSPVKTDERLVIVTPTYAWRIPAWWRIGCARRISLVPNRRGSS